VLLIKGWGKVWYIVGIAGTIALILSWNIVNASLLVKGVVTPYDDVSIAISIAIEISQVVFIAAVSSIIIRGRQTKKIPRI
jgi:hypothetical protein